MESAAPIIVAGHPALDFLNTVASPHGEAIELLGDGRALLEWLALVGGIDAAEARTLARRFTAGERAATAARAVALRAWLRRIVARSAARGAARLTPAELRHLNAILAGGARHLEVAPHRPGYVARTRLRWRTADDLLVPIAEAIVDLLTSVDFALVRRCAGASCTLWFLDRTKRHHRQWCTMEICGNRAKVAAHRRRAALARPRGA